MNRQMSVAPNMNLPTYNASIADSVKKAGPDAQAAERKNSVNSMGIFEKLNKQDVRNYKRYENTKNFKET